MFALSKVLRRSQSLRLGACNAVYSKLDIPLGERNIAIESNALIHDKHEALPRFYELSWSSSTGRRSLSSDAGAKTTGDDDDLEDKNVDLATPDETSSDSEDGEEFSGDEGDIEGAELELHVPESKRPSEMFKAIVSVSGLSVGSALDKWVEQGKDTNRKEFESAMLQLRKRRMFGRALQTFCSLSVFSRFCDVLLLV
jgi:hypothetical protein